MASILDKTTFSRRRTTLGKKKMSSDGSFEAGRAAEEDLVQGQRAGAARARKGSPCQFSPKASVQGRNRTGLASRDLRSQAGKRY
jgi:hypothetical protein